MGWPIMAMPTYLMAALLYATTLTSALEILPPVGLTEGSHGQKDLNVDTFEKTIFMLTRDVNRTDDAGLTLIPPTAYEFATVFQQDLMELTGCDWTLLTVDNFPEPPASGLFLGLYDGSHMTYANSEPNYEGYTLGANSRAASIIGTGTRGLWWGTRTFLQLLLVGNGTIKAGERTDAPAYATRGYMLDAGRKWYSKGFLKELCSYASFFKMNEFHYHLSDNYPLNRGRNESWRDVYSHFSLLPEDEALRGIVHGRENETLTRAEFEESQSHCARRGVAVIPEIEAPGHSLYLTKWKPELALEKKDLLNLSHPDTLPTVKRIWEEFLPWFQTKEVHLGADEYDPTLADDYITFVNAMNAFIQTESGKRVRIWGTYEPSTKNLTLDKDITIQHWQYGQSDPLQVVVDNCTLINSQDWWAYMSLKSDHMPILPARYPQFFNETRVLDFGDQPGWQWTPALVNHVNATMQLRPEEPRLAGAIMAAWNDNGPDATTQLEAYYAMRRGIALVGARVWSGVRGPEVDAETAAASVDFLGEKAPAQNLDRKVVSDGKGPLVSWKRGPEDGQTVHLGRGSKGINYTLALTTSGPFTLSGPDTTLTLSADGSLVFFSDGWPYPLRHTSPSDALRLDAGHPGRIWVNATASTHEPITVQAPVEITISTDVVHGSVVWLDGKVAGRFEVFVYGGRNTLFSWNQMALVAPLDEIEGGLESVEVEAGTRFDDELETS